MRVVKSIKDEDVLRGSNGNEKSVLVNIDVSNGSGRTQRTRTPKSAIPTLQSEKPDVISIGAPNSNAHQVALLNYTSVSYKEQFQNSNVQSNVQNNMEDGTKLKGILSSKRNNSGSTSNNVNVSNNNNNTPSLSTSSITNSASNRVTFCKTDDIRSINTSNNIPIDASTNTTSNCTNNTKKELSIHTVDDESTVIHTEYVNIQTPRQYDMDASKAVASTPVMHVSISDHEIPLLLPYASSPDSIGRSSSNSMVAGTPVVLPNLPHNFTTSTHMSSNTSNTTPKRVKSTSLTPKSSTLTPRASNQTPVQTRRTVSSSPYNSNSSYSSTSNNSNAFFPHTPLAATGSSGSTGSASGGRMPDPLPPLTAVHANCSSFYPLYITMYSTSNPKPINLGQVPCVYNSSVSRASVTAQGTSIAYGKNYEVLQTELKRQLADEKNNSISPQYVSGSYSNTSSNQYQVSPLDTPVLDENEGSMTPNIDAGYSKRRRSARQEYNHVYDFDGKHTTASNYYNLPRQSKTIRKIARDIVIAKGRVTTPYWEQIRFMQKLKPDQYGYDPSYFSIATPNEESEIRDVICSKSVCDAEIVNMDLLREKEQENMYLLHSLARVHLFWQKKDLQLELSQTEEEYVLSIETATTCIEVASNVGVIDGSCLQTPSKSNKSSNASVGGSSAKTKAIDAITKVKKVQEKYIDLLLRYKHVCIQYGQCMAEEEAGGWNTKRVVDSWTGDAYIPGYVGFNMLETHPLLVDEEDLSDEKYMRMHIATEHTLNVSWDQVLLKHGVGTGLKKRANGNNIKNNEDSMANSSLPSLSLQPSMSASVAPPLLLASPSGYVKKTQKWRIDDKLDLTKNLALVLQDCSIADMKQMVEDTDISLHQLCPNDVGHMNGEDWNVVNIDATVVLSGHSKGNSCPPQPWQDEQQQWNYTLPNTNEGFCLPMMSYIRPTNVHIPITANLLLSQPQSLGKIHAAHHTYNSCTRKRKQQLKGYQLPGTPTTVGMYESGTSDDEVSRKKKKSVKQSKSVAPSTDDSQALAMAMNAFGTLVSSTTEEMAEKCKSMGFNKKTTEQMIEMFANKLSPQVVQQEVLPPQVVGTPRNTTIKFKLKGSVPDPTSIVYTNTSNTNTTMPSSVTSPASLLTSITPPNVVVPITNNTSTNTSPNNVATASIPTSATNTPVLSNILTPIQTTHGIFHIKLPEISAEDQAVLTLSQQQEKSLNALGLFTVDQQQVYAQQQFQTWLKEASTSTQIKSFTQEQWVKEQENSWSYIVAYIQQQQQITLHRIVEQQQQQQQQYA